MNVAKVIAYFVSQKQEEKGVSDKYDMSRAVAFTFIIRH